MVRSEDIIDESHKSGYGQNERNVPSNAHFPRPALSGTELFIPISHVGKPLNN
jgi:hypothetical protein